MPGTPARPAMNHLSSRIREILEESRVGASVPPAAEDSARAPAAALDLDRVSAALGGHVLTTALGPCVVVERTFLASYCHGTSTTIEDVGTERDAIGLLMGGPVDWTVGSANLGGRLVYFDLETTGLGGGAGSRAFLVGCGSFTDSGFQTCQLFLPSPSFERALLAQAALRLHAADAIVSFNGKSFDAPMLETRWAFHRMGVTLDDRPHLDLLHPARRLWRGPRAGAWRDSTPASFDVAERCTLDSLERGLLGVSRLGDPDGFEIPSIYFDYMRTSDPARLDAVFEHNRLDLLSLVALTARAVRLVRAGPEGDATPTELLGLGRIFERGGRSEAALRCFERAGASETQAPTTVGWPGPERRRRDGDTVRAEALRRLARGLRQARRFAAAAAAWQRLSDLEPNNPTVRLETFEALAVHHEHRTRNLTKARQLALRAFEDDHEPIRRRRLEHRLERLDRKLARDESPGGLLDDGGADRR